MKRVRCSKCRAKVQPMVVVEGFVAHAHCERCGWTRHYRLTPRRPWKLHGTARYGRLSRSEAAEFLRLMYDESLLSGVREFWWNGGENTSPFKRCQGIDERITLRLDMEQKADKISLSLGTALDAVQQPLEPEIIRAVDGALFNLR